MNNTIQAIGVIVVAGIALLFLIKKFFFKTKKKNSKSCGSDNCKC